MEITVYPIYTPKVYLKCSTADHLIQILLKVVTASNQLLHLKICTVYINTVYQLKDSTHYSYNIACIA